MKFERDVPWPSAHNGRDDCPNSRPIRIWENYIWILNYVDYYDGHVALCASKSGKIFGDYVSNEQMIEFFNKYGAWYLLLLVGATSGKNSVFINSFLIFWETDSHKNQQISLFNLQSLGKIMFV